MLAADIMAKLEKTVRQFLEENRMFTGYDVTLETRVRESLKLRHSDCRGAIHEMQFLSDAVDFGYDTSGQTVNWKKTQTDVGVGAWAFVYHPENLDPASYQSGNPVPVNVPQISVTPSAVVSVITVADDADDSKDSGGENSDGTFSTDYRNRLMVKTRFARSIGLNAGDDVTIVSDSTKQTITLLSGVSVPQQASAIVVSTQRVERNGDFRLSSSTLRSAGLNGSKFKIEQSSAPLSNGTAMNILEIFAA